MIRKGELVTIDWAMVGFKIEPEELAHIAFALEVEFAALCDVEETSHHRYMFTVRDTKDCGGMRNEEISDRFVKVAKTAAREVMPWLCRFDDWASELYSSDLKVTPQAHLYEAVRTPLSGV